MGSVAETRNQKCSIPEFVEKLHVYDLSSNPTSSEEEFAVWQSLTSCMKGRFLSRLTGKGWNEWSISSTHEYVYSIFPIAYSFHILFDFAAGALCTNAICLFTNY